MIQLVFTIQSCSERNSQLHHSLCQQGAQHAEAGRDHCGTFSAEDFLHWKSKKMLISLAAELLVIARSGYSSYSQIAQELPRNWNCWLSEWGVYHCLPNSSHSSECSRPWNLASDSSPDRLAPGFPRWLYESCVILQEKKHVMSGLFL